MPISISQDILDLVAPENCKKELEKAQAQVKRNYAAQLSNIEEIPGTINLQAAKYQENVDLKKIEEVQLPTVRNIPQTGAATTKGGREKLEDRSEFCTLAKDYTTQVYAYSLASAIIEMGQSVEQQKSGSTLCASIIIPAVDDTPCTIITGSVGDSRSLLFFQKNNEWNFLPLNVSHNLQYLDKDEIARINATENFYFDEEHQRIFDKIEKQSLLNMSRALGDSHLHPTVIYIPSITVVSLPPKTEQAFVITVTDGITDTWNNSPILPLFNKILPDYISNAQELADAIINPMLNFPCLEIFDNAVILTTLLSENSLNEPIMQLVADGHSGHDIAEKIKQEFPSLVQANLQLFSERLLTTESIPNSEYFMNDFSSAEIKQEDELLLDIVDPLDPLDPVDLESESEEKNLQGFINPSSIQGTFYQPKPMLNTHKPHQKRSKRRCMLI